MDSQGSHNGNEEEHPPTESELWRMPWMLDKFKALNIEPHGFGGQADVILLYVQPSLYRSDLKVPQHAICKRFKGLTGKDAPSGTTEDYLIQNELRVYKKIMENGGQFGSLSCAKQGKFTFHFYAEGKFQVEVRKKKKPTPDNPNPEKQPTTIVPGPYLTFFAMEAGTLSLESIIKRSVCPSLKYRLWLFQQLVSVMACFDPEKTRFYHRDIKPANFVFAEKDSETNNSDIPEANYQDLRVIDFGLSSWDGEGGHFATGGDYIPPNEGTDKQHADKYDLYSLGYMLVALLLWSVESSTVMPIIKECQTDEGKPSLKLDLSELEKLIPRKALGKLLKGLLHKDPAKRMSWGELFTHELMNAKLTQEEIDSFKLEPKVQSSQTSSSPQCMSEALEDYSYYIKMQSPPNYYGIFKDKQQEIEQILAKDRENSDTTKSQSEASKVEPMSITAPIISPMMTLKLVPQDNEEPQAPRMSKLRPQHREPWDAAEEFCKNNLYFSELAKSSVKDVAVQFVALLMPDTAVILHHLALNKLCHQSLKSEQQYLIQVVFGLTATASMMPGVSAHSALPENNGYGSVSRCKSLLILEKVEPQPEFYQLQHVVLNLLLDLVANKRLSHLTEQTQRIFIRLYIIIYWRQEIKGLTQSEIIPIFKQLTDGSDSVKRSFEHYKAKFEKSLEYHQQQDPEATIQTNGGYNGSG